MYGKLLPFTPEGISLGKSGESASKICINLSRCCLDVFSFCSDCRIRGGARSPIPVAHNQKKMSWIEVLAHQSQSFL